MNLMKWEPFREMDKLFDEFAFVPFVPKTKFGWDFVMDLYEVKDNLIAEAHLPGINPEKIDVSFQDGNLKITVMKEEEKETKDKHFYFMEIKKGSFERLINLPCEVKKEKIQAEFKNGVLKIIMPKKEELKEKIKVEVH